MGIRYNWFRLAPTLATVLALGVGAAMSGCGNRLPSHGGAAPATSSSTPSVTPTSSTTTTAAPSLGIASPTGSLNCAHLPSQCQFIVKGTIAPKLPTGEQIVILVYPISPSGHGWYVQMPPAIAQGNRGWLQTPADIGSPKAPAHVGDTLEIAAILVRDNATYKGKPLQAISVSQHPISDMNQIVGIITHSNAISLTVRSS